MVIFHLFIISTFPLAVPLEWNVFFAFAVLVLWGGLGYGLDASVYNIWNFSEPLLLIPIAALVLVFPIWGNLRPDQISFLPSMRQYAGNWASATFSFRDKSMEDRINERIVKAADNQIDQLDPLFGKEISEIFIQKAMAFRMMHPMGRMHITLQMRHNDDIDTRVLRGPNVWWRTPAIVMHVDLAELEAWPSDRISIQGRVHQHLYERGDLHRAQGPEGGTGLVEEGRAGVAGNSRRGRVDVAAPAVALALDRDVSYGSSPDGSSCAW